MRRIFPLIHFFFFFNDTATTEIYTLSLHDALPICRAFRSRCAGSRRDVRRDSARKSRSGSPWADLRDHRGADRKSTRLNSSHLVISYAVFCLKKKTQTPPCLPTDPLLSNHTSCRAT